MFAMLILRKKSQAKTGTKLIIVLAILILPVSLFGHVNRKPKELRQNLPLEMLGVVKLAKTYDVEYDFKACGLKMESIHKPIRYELASEQVYATGYSIPAFTNRGAFEFAQSAFPECEIKWLYRVRLKSRSLKHYYEERRALIWSLGDSCPAFEPEWAEFNKTYAD